MDIVDQIIDYTRNEERIFIQTHNFPDHDAVASAFGLQTLLAQLGIRSYIIYDGEMQRDSLKQMIRSLGIDIRHNAEMGLVESDRIVIVDGCKGNKNITDLIGDEIAVIDHHRVSSPEDVLFSDIRPEYGACSSIIYGFFRSRQAGIPRNTATALMLGINMDTALLTRGVSREDIDAYAGLYPLSDIRLENAILRNYIQTKDLGFYRYAIDHVKITGAVAYCYFPQGCNQNLLGILGDFFLALEEVDFVILCARNGGQVNFSLRSEREEWNASLIIQEALRGIGFGGGHADMAGGIINDPGLFQEDEIHRLFLQRLGG